MKILTPLLTLAILGSMFACDPAPKNEDWKLKWSDEFEVDGAPDSTKWVFSPWHPLIRDRHELTYVKDGKLILKAMLNDDPTDTSKYMAAGVETLGKMDFLYGKLDVSAKLGAAKGSWPAIWLKPVDTTDYGAWPLCGEIDIMEHLNSDTMIYHTMHTYYIKTMGHKTNPDYYVTAPFKQGEFNVFGMEWYPDRIDMFINGTLTFSYPRLEKHGFYQWPFDVPFFLLLNQVLGGWAGEIVDEELPVQMEVDYVRYYTK